MSKRYVASNVTCPFYQSESHQVIYCESPEPGSVLHLAFSDRGKKYTYKGRCCMRGGKGCKVAQLLEKQYEEES